MRISDWSSDVCSSDLKMMHGAFFLPCSNMSRTRDAPTPTNISTKSEPEMVKNGTFASPAMARASSVLPDRKSVVSGKSVSVRVDLGGRRIIKKKNYNKDVTSQITIRNKDYIQK